MTKYREILRLKSLNLSQQNIANSCNVSKKTVNRVLKHAEELGISWPLAENDTDASLAEKFFPSAKQTTSTKRMPDYDYIHKELLRNGVTKKLLWTEYMEDCRANGDEPLMYSQFCYHIQQDEQKRRATMHINRKPGEQVEVDWAGDPATIIDPNTGEIIKTYLFVGVITYSQYAYVEVFLDMKQKSWITAHVHMYEFFGGVARILVPNNCKTAVVHNGGWKDQQINETYLGAMIADDYPDCGILSQEICDAWIRKCSVLHQNTLLRRVTPVRQFAKYILGTGKFAYIIPGGIPRKQIRYDAHIFTEAELKAFFASVDKCK